MTNTVLTFSLAVVALAAVFVVARRAAEASPMEVLREEYSLSKVAAWASTSFFNKHHPGHWSDIFRAVKTEEGYEIERLSDAVNYRGTDADPFVSPDGDYFIFRSNRPGGVGRADLWISFNVDGEWTPAQNLGEPINSPAVDYCPFVTFDGRFLIFTSERFIETFHADAIEDFDDMLAKSRGWDNGRGNLYWVSTAFLDELRPSAAR